MNKKLMKYGEIKQYARHMRNNPTPSELKLWGYLRNRQLEGRKFLRQHPLLYEFSPKEFFFFIPDFYCYQDRLIIELDGPIHEYQLEKDEKREKILQNMGFTVLRFKNEDLNDMDNVLKTIISHFDRNGESNFKRKKTADFKEI
jgi:very-short-patch-repair endonuclease